MGTNRIKYGISALAACMVVSCDNYFDNDGKGNMDRDGIVNSFENYRGIWAFMYNGLENGFTRVAGTMLAAACDEADNNQPFGAVQRFNVGGWNGVTNPDNNSWLDLYGYIRQANLLIEMSDTTVNDFLRFETYRLDDDSRYDEYRAEWYAYGIDAEFFKAYYHFELWKRFGNIPIMDRMVTEEEARRMQQASTGEIIGYITGKLNKIIPMYDQLAAKPASKYLPAGNGGGYWIPTEEGRITKGAALALKCRAYLYAASPLHNGGSYNTEYCDSAAKAAADIIALGQYTIEGTSYRQLFLNYSNTENILDSRTALYYDASGAGSDAGRINYPEYWNYPRVGGNNVLYEDRNVGTNAVCPSQNLVDAYRTADGYAADLDFSGSSPFAAITDRRFFQTVIYPGSLFNGRVIDTSAEGAAARGAINSTSTGYFLKKFIHENINLNNGETVRHAWYLFRYGEVLLNYAEAVFNGSPGFDTGVGLSAAQALNLLHRREDVPAGIRVLPQSHDFTDATLSNEAIRRERQVELAFEGHRFWDVRRWMIAGQTENMPLGGIDYRPGTPTPYSRIREVEPRVFAAPKMYFYPIPQEDLVNYPNWTNNGW